MVSSAASKRKEWKPTWKEVKQTNKVSIHETIGQEARESKVSKDDEQNRMPLSSLQLGLVFIPPRRDFRVRAKMECCKKGRFCTPRKRHWSSSQEPINHYSKYRHSWIHFDAGSFKSCSLFVVWQEWSILLSKVLMIKFLTLGALFSFVTPSSVKTSDGVFFEGRTSLKRVLSDMGFRYESWHIVFSQVVTFFVVFLGIWKQARCLITFWLMPHVNYCTYINVLIRAHWPIQVLTCMLH